MSWTWDPGKDDANVRRHGRSFETAPFVFDDPLALSVPDQHLFEECWITIGVIGNRFITVVHTAPKNEARVTVGLGRIISARKSSRAERMAYEEGIR